MARTASVVLTLASILVLAGCPGPLEPPPDVPEDRADAGTDAPLPDGAIPEEDGGTDDGGTSDGGIDASIDGGVIIPGPSMEAPPSEIIRMGTGGYLLRGTVLTPTGPLLGEVLVVGDTITCVAATCTGTAGADTVTVIDTHAVISPGLIDGHNHLTYDFIDEWVPDPPELFSNRYEWRSDDDYGDWARPEGDSDNNGSQDTGAQCPGAKWGELRSLIHGTTTIQGQLPPNRNCVDRLARNADQYHGLGTDFMQTTISGPCESGFPNDAGRATLIGNFTSGMTTRYVMHMGEGFEPTSASVFRANPVFEFDCLAGRRPPGVPDSATFATTSLLFENPATMTNPYETSVMIHSIPLTNAELDESVLANARVVWSPSSNLILYGRTAPIEEMLARNLSIGMGPDWTISGEDHMLGEMRVGLDYGATMGITELTPRRIWEMATMDGADVVGLAPAIGSIEVGARADLVIFGRIGTDPYRAVLDSRARDVRLTMVNGLGYYGDLTLEAAAAVNGSCETIDACGIEKFICVANTPGNAIGMADTMESIHAQLNTILTAHGRPGTVLPLINCSE
jgi:hypothetical protein